MQRFSRLSRGGGGEWEPLALSTVMSRRNNKTVKVKKKVVDVRIRHARKGGKSTLVEVTKKTKKKPPKPIRAASILIDTGLLFGVLAPSPSPGWLEDDTSSGFRFGYGGPTRHPDGGPTLADIASFHQSGSTYLPRRRIIVEPDSTTLNLLTRRITEWLEKQTR